MWSSQENKKDTKVYDLKEALSKAEAYCAYQERSHKQVKEKLKGFGLRDDVVDELIFSLIQSNFINETRFAEAFVRGKFNIKGWGRIKIRQHLKFHQVSDYNIKLGMKQIEEDKYIQRFDLLADKKWIALKEENVQQKKQKLLRFLSSRGFESQLVYDYLRGLK